MLFSTFSFIACFLPIVVFLFWFSKKNDTRILILLTSSILFYVYHSIHDLLIMLGSIGFNFLLAKKIQRNQNVLIFAVISNILFLSYYKYSFFIFDNLNYIFPGKFYVKKTELPLGISFFTFQQIAYLVDAYYGGIVEKKISKYALLVSFFPHSIAGPLVQYKEIVLQFDNFSFKQSNFIKGMLIFIAGLFKKVVIADSLAPCVNSVFDVHIANGLSPSFAEAWFSCIAYTFQLYFDFSGYSDMAMGLAKIFNIKFPINFDSPYKSISVIEFWRKWHITLSNFLRNYVYLPLGGNRCSSFVRYRNILCTMLLGGLWHGASWNFIIWGGIHGLLLIVNHQYRDIKKQMAVPDSQNKIYKLLCGTFTFLLISSCWVLFRAQDLHSALLVYKSMFLFRTPSFPISLSGWIPSYIPIEYNGFFENNIFYFVDFLPYLILSFFLCFFFPNVKEFFSLDQALLGTQNHNSYFSHAKRIAPFTLNSIKYKQNVFYAIFYSVVLYSILIFMLAHKENVFLYFNF